VISPNKDVFADQLLRFKRARVVAWDSQWIVVPAHVSHFVPASLGLQMPSAMSISSIRDVAQIRMVLDLQTPLGGLVTTMGTLRNKW